VCRSQATGLTAAARPWTFAVMATMWRGSEEEEEEEEVKGQEDAEEERAQGELSAMNPPWRLFEERVAEVFLSASAVHAQGDSESARTSFAIRRISYVHSFALELVANMHGLDEGVRLPGGVDRAQGASETTRACPAVQRTADDDAVASELASNAHGLNRVADVALDAAVHGEAPLAVRETKRPCPAIQRTANDDAIASEPASNAHGLSKVADVGLDAAVHGEAPLAVRAASLPIAMGLDGSPGEAVKPDDADATGHSAVATGDDTGAVSTRDSETGAELRDILDFGDADAMGHDSLTGASPTDAEAVDERCDEGLDIGDADAMGHDSPTGASPTDAEAADKQCDKGLLMTRMPPKGRWRQPSASFFEPSSPGGRATSSSRSRTRRASCSDLDCRSIDVYSRIDAVRQAFYDCDARGVGVITPGDLARWWASAAEDKNGLRLTSEMRGLIAADVQHFFEQVDVFKSGAVTIDQWLHFALLEAHPPGTVATTAIAEGLRELEDTSMTSVLTDTWLMADTTGTGLVSLGRIAASLRAEGATWDADLLLQEFGSDMSRNVSYAEFCAQQVGLGAAPVELLYYDISKSFAKYLAPLLFGHSEEGVWHSSIVAFGKEFFYFGEIQIAEPASTPFGKPTKRLQLGTTLRTRRQLQVHIELELNQKFQCNAYDIFTNNCNHCCDDLALFLLGRHIPNEVRFLSDRLMRTSIVRALRPMLNRWLGGVGRASPQAVDPDSNVVVFEHPASIAPVFALVVKDRVDGTTDLCWLDKAGNRRVSQGVRRCDVRPFQVPDVATSQARARESAASGEPWAREAYMEALGAISGRRRSAPDAGKAAGGGTTCGHRPLPLVLPDEVEIELEAPQITTDMKARDRCGSWPCDRGHDWGSKRHRFWQGYVQNRKCGDCRRRMPRTELRMVCKRCKLIRCEICWEARRDAGDGSPNVRSRGNALRAAVDSSPKRRCLRGHQLERLAGQTLRGGAACRNCGMKELGATFPFFLSCRLCEFDVCPLCIDSFVQRRPSMRNGWRNVM